MSFSGQPKWVLERLKDSPQAQMEARNGERIAEIGREREAKRQALERAYQRGVYMDAFKAELARINARPHPYPSPEELERRNRPWVEGPPISKTVDVSPRMSKALTAYLEKGYNPYLLADVLEKAGNRRTLIRKSSPTPFHVNQPTASEQLITWLAQHDPNALVDIANLVYEHDGE
jgi:hypothetical protein